MGADDHLRDWLARGMTGCEFAKRIAAKPERLIQVTFPALASEPEVSRVFELGASALLPVVVMFSGIRSEAALAQQLSVLAGGARWSLTEEHPDGFVTDDVLVGISWQVTDALSSSIMGFAPFASMPVTRRAPYVCIAGWPGRHENPHWRRYEEGIVHFLDTNISALKLTPAKYKDLNKASIAATKRLLSEPNDDARFYRRAAFRLQPSVRELLRTFVKP